MNKLTHKDTLNEQWQKAKRERFLSLLRQGYEANVTLLELLEFMQAVELSDALASTRVIAFLPVESVPEASRQLRGPSTNRVAVKPRTKPVKRRLARSQAARLETAVLDRVNVGLAPVSTAQIVAVMQNQFSGLERKTVENKLRDLHRRGKIRKHSSLRATWMKQTLAVAPTIVRHSQRLEQAQLEDANGRAM